MKKEEKRTRNRRPLRPTQHLFVLLENLDFNDFYFLIQNNIILLLKGKIAIKNLIQTAGLLLQIY